MKDPFRDSADSGDGQRAAHVRQTLRAFLGDQADMEEVRAMLRGWIDDVRRKNLPPEQALVEFKALLPLSSRQSEARGDGPSAKHHSDLISLFIQEYYADESSAEGDA